MILMKQLEGKKRQEEMNRKREELRVVREREFELRLEQKRLEIEVMTEMRKPLEDMSLSDHKDLPELKRISNLKLSGEAFANTLMVYEFLHNFGETLGFGENFSTLTSNEIFNSHQEESSSFFALRLAFSHYWMGSISYYHCTALSLSSVHCQLTSATSKLLERQESNPGPLIGKKLRNPVCYAPPPPMNLVSLKGILLKAPVC